MSKTPAQVPEMLQRTLPCRSRQERVISYMLDESINEPTSQLRELRAEIHQLKQKDAVHRLTISKLTSENQTLKHELAEAQSKLQKQESVMRSDRMYIQTLDKEVRRMREASKGKENDASGRHNQVLLALEHGKDYQKDNLNLLAEVENLMFQYLRRGIKEQPLQQHRPTSNH